ncbi:NAD(P)-dependent alcohol dehydrogenase [Bradyrhizobium brasilense]|uniref:NAD(P)-dependent alcohol dehydrogenase n=1 Tax=Bradyrhizobium brasilense TaxID=1419277 RepID=UPI001E3DDF50|nr:NAD(P)-dependent alcohol dehydrogenase [Bradyrhizobium brasilense]MCC8971573.1 NAD(P)-dependent alcohol dehydrogenase [Bradyrhizobium brasilense]
MQVSAAVARKPEADFTIEQLSLEEPREDEILVRIAGVGLCHTDLIARDQLIPIPLPAVLGHEGSGVVEQVGSKVKKVTAGDHVLLSFNSCGHCKTCEEHLPSYCLKFPQLNYTGLRMDGSSALSKEGERVSANFFGQSSFASHAIANERNVVKVDKSLPLQLLGPLGCGLQTGAGGVLRSMNCPEGSSIAIFGGGPVGLAAVMGAAIRKCSTIILVEPVAARRDIALELGATHAIDPRAGDLTAAIRAIAPQGVEFAFDSSGRSEVLDAALASLTSRGLLGLVGVPPKIESTLSFNIAWLITYGIRIQGIIEGDSDLDGFLPELVEYYQAGRFPFDRLVKTYPLAEINRAIADQAKGACIKAVLVP